MVSSKPTACIDQWTLVKTPDGGRVLLGKISGHPQQERFLMSFQHTSYLIREDYENGMVETLNTIYLLGQPHTAISNPLGIPEH